MAPKKPTDPKNAKGKASAVHPAEELDHSQNVTARTPIDGHVLIFSSGYPAGRCNQCWLTRSEVLASLPQQPTEAVANMMLLQHLMGHYPSMADESITVKGKERQEALAEQEGPKKKARKQAAVQKLLKAAKEGKVKINLHLDEEAEAAALRLMQLVESTRTDSGGEDEQDAGEEGGVAEMSGGLPDDNNGWVGPDDDGDDFIR